YFGFEHVQVTGAVFNPEKLLWINSEHLKKASSAQLLKLIQEDFGFQFSAVNESYVIQLISHLQPKIKLLKELPEQLQTLCVSGVSKVDGSDLKWNKSSEQKGKIKEAIQFLHQDCSSIISKAGKSTLAECGVGHSEIDSKLRVICEKFGIKLGEFTQPMRLYVTGQPHCHIGLFDLLPIMPWKTVSSRLEACLKD
ncbi:MAG: hypothetical protein ACKOA8_00685, partial [Deltaproteobacteria bacterium]